MNGGYHHLFPLLHVTHMCLGPYASLDRHYRIRPGPCGGITAWHMAPHGLDGGAKGGINCDPSKLSEAELYRITTDFVRLIKEIIGPTIDIPAPDVTRTPRSWAGSWTSTNMDGLVRRGQRGKPVDLFGSLGRDEATGRGIMYVLEECLAPENRKLSDVTVAIQGFGNVGSHSARLISEHGGKIVAVSDISGGIANDQGIDIPALLAGGERKSSGKRIPGGKRCRRSRSYRLQGGCCSIPAAMEEAITGTNASDVQVKSWWRRTDHAPSRDTTSWSAKA